jgi:hypothetical protein
MQDLYGKGWTNCPPGVLDQLASRMEYRRRSVRRTNIMAAIISSTVLAGILGLAGVLASQAMGYSLFSSSTSGPGTHQKQWCPPQRASGH